MFVIKEKGKDLALKFKDQTGTKRISLEFEIVRSKRNEVL